MTNKLSTLLIVFFLGSTVTTFSMVDGVVTRSATQDVNVAPLKSTLLIGNRGTEVEALQNFLEKKRLLILPAGQPKGFFGKRTKNALMEYQKSVKLETTGTVGPRTRNAINVENVSKVNTSIAPVTDGVNNINAVENKNITPVVKPKTETVTQTKVSASTTDQPLQEDRESVAKRQKVFGMNMTNACKGLSLDSNCSIKGIYGESLSGKCIPSPEPKVPNNSNLICAPVYVAPPVPVLPPETVPPVDQPVN